MNEANQLSTSGRPFKEIIRPGPGRLAAKVIRANQKYVGEGGVELWIPDMSWTGRQGEGHLGEVVAVCTVPYMQNGVVIEENDYPIGSIVIFGKYTGTAITIGRDELVIMSEQDVLSEVLQIPEEDAPSDDTTPDADLIRAFDTRLHSGSPVVGDLQPRSPSDRATNQIPPLPPELRLTPADTGDT